MHTLFTPDLGRQIVNDRLREAENRRTVRLFRNRGAAGEPGTASTERVVRRSPRRRTVLGSDIIGAR